jgi:hypothetical protein
MAASTHNGDDRSHLELDEDFRETETAAGAMSLLASTMSGVQQVCQRLRTLQDSESFTPTPVDSHLDPSRSTVPNFPGTLSASATNRRNGGPIRTNLTEGTSNNNKDHFLGIILEQLNDTMLRFDATTALGRPSAQSPSPSGSTATVSNAEILYAMEQDLDWLDRLIEWWLNVRPTIPKQMEFFYRSCVQNMRLIDAYSTA